MTIEMEIIKEGKVNVIEFPCLREDKKGNIYYFTSREKNVLLTFSDSFRFFDFYDNVKFIDTLPFKGKIVLTSK